MLNERYLLPSFMLSKRIVKVTTKYFSSSSKIYVTVATATAAAVTVGSN